MNSWTVTMPVGVVVRQAPGVTKWARRIWRAVAVIPGAPQADWVVMRREGDTVDFHAGTLPLTLHRSETEAYLTAISCDVPKFYVVMRTPLHDSETRPLDLLTVTASPYEAQDYTDNGEDIVEPVAMPPAMIAWIQSFIDKHHHDEVFIKRKRDKSRIDRVQDGIGDPRIKQTTDVYRAPRPHSTEEPQ